MVGVTQIAFFFSPRSSLVLSLALNFEVVRLNDFIEYFKDVSECLIEVVAGVCRIRGSKREAESFRESHKAKHTNGH